LSGIGGPADAGRSFRIRLTVVLVIPEEEQFVANDRSADRTADVVVLKVPVELVWSCCGRDELSRVLKNIVPLKSFVPLFVTY